MRRKYFGSSRPGNMVILEPTHLRHPAKIKNHLKNEPSPEEVPLLKRMIPIQETAGKKKSEESTNSAYM